MKTIAIGGVGGSGTRSVAEIVRRLGYYIGDDLNQAHDNLWFSLLFKRAAVLTATVDEFAGLAEGFIARMRNGVGLPFCLSFKPERQQFEHDAEWLAARLHSFATQPSSRTLDQPWGWKEPNTHLVIEQWLRHLDNLIYVHVRRHPLDMAFGRNLNQLRNWAPMILHRPVTEGPRDALSYWCAAERRIELIRRFHPDRVHIVEFDTICRDPERFVLGLATLLGVTELPERVTDIAGAVQQPALLPRTKAVDLSVFDAADLQTICDLGYSLSSASLEPSPPGP
jgi:hypothetical protein